MEPSKAGEARIVAGLLGAIERDGHSSQRNLARELGIALGLANAYLKRCVKKGLIKVRRAPAKRYAYYITPKGLAEKTKLTTEYLTYSLSFFRRARTSLSATFATARELNWSRVALIGAGDLAEIAILCAFEHDIRIIAVVDPDWEKARFVGTPVVGTVGKLPEEVNGFILTTLSEPQGAYDRLVKECGPQQVLAPDVLGVATRHSRTKGAA